MSDVFDDVVSYFEKEHADYCEVDKEGKCIEMSMAGDNQVYRIFCIVSGDIFRLYIPSILKVPENKMAYACMLANMINEEAFPTFTISPDDGELMAGIHFAVKGCKLSHDAINIMFVFLTAQTDIYYPTFQNLIWADVSPEQAFNSRVTADSYFKSHTQD